jgi:adenylate cyclase
MGLFAELKRRHVVKVAIVYATVGFAVVQVADLLLPRMDVPEWGVNAIMAAVLLGFPIALVLTWALEVTPDGVKRTRSDAQLSSGVDLAAESPVAGPATKPASAASHRSIAVLPFTNLSRDPDNEYFSDGITEEILMALSKVRGLRVISRTSVMQYKGSFRAVRDIAGELAVAHVLEGSVRRAGDRVRIAAQLIDARSDEHLWAESYDRNLDDVFAIQSDVAERIVRSLEVALTPTERARLEARPTKSMEAHEWYLKGRHLIARRMEASLRSAVEAFRKAVAADDDYAQAWSGLADALTLLAFYSDAKVADVLPEARRAAERAVSLDPGLGEAHASLGFVADAEKSSQEAVQEFEKAIELSPGYTTAYAWYGITLRNLGRHEEAIAVTERAQALDPVSSPIRMALGAAYQAGGDLERAEAIWREGLELDPDYAAFHVNLAEQFEAQDRLDEALAEIGAISRLNPDRYSPEFVAGLKAAKAAEGSAGYWKAKAEWLKTRARTGQDILDVATALIKLGRVDEAMDRLERAVDDPVVRQVVWLPQFEPIRSNPRFQALVRKVSPG